MDGLTDGVTSGAQSVADRHAQGDNTIRDGKRPARMEESRRYAPWRCSDP